MEDNKNDIKEDGLFYEGAFWIIADSVIDILKGKFELLGEKILVNYEGDPVEIVKTKRGDVPHKKLWQQEAYNTWNKKYDYKFFPRGRVSVYKGNAFVNIHSKMNTPKIIDSITEYYKIRGLDLNIVYPNNQGDHYEFGLE
ncbi:MAG: hypothetical protein GX959_01985 [Clostridiales bacterium]|jgi:hypothetical protein|nr:hypothetical protein [Clostridiales bacterium]